LTLTPALRFPNPIPSGTRVPQWALLDVTVCFLAFFLDNILTTRSRTGTIGTLTNRMPSVVGTFSRLFSRYCLTMTPASYFHRLTRAGSWHNNWPFKLLRLEKLDLEYSHVEYRHVESSRFEYSPAYTCRATQFKRGAHRWWNRRRGGSNLYSCCHFVILFAKATFTGDVCPVRYR
jgi:hypothetical protein